MGRNGVAPKKWRLRIEGLVEERVPLGLEKIKTLPKKTRDKKFIILKMGHKQPIVRRVP